jgi:hypothetical protein
LVAEGHEYELDTGAKIFCEPDQYAATRVAVKHLERTFRPYHVVATEKHLPSVLYTVRSFPHSLKVKLKSSRLIAYIGRSDETRQTPPPSEGVKKNPTRHVGGGPQVDNPHQSGMMPLFVQLPSKTDVAEDNEDVGRAPQLSTMRPASELQAPYVDSRRGGYPYGQRLGRTA